ncbi:hypothetical protein AU468_13885 [Alkalispirochaeta sphaeroplastigenens]|uniref:Uncharacterized protein n=1 Tax=Alkalispirochaeta sphaeroplastigenens TaxID=1187066 RepID=A0A2S4JFL0_9SPIO|nr:hypothetical protein [Alkalispirochaeta sphaeroplastigenens]POQ98302.1 hypothetical protein AU468_13885 [Alkalispirochaeta sphaeroplastigenens]
MPAKIHYQDNLFFLHSIIRTIESGLRLDIDPEYFRDKILEDIFFVHAVLQRKHRMLKEQEQLIHRTTYLRALRRTAAFFRTFLSRLLESETSFQDAFTPYLERLKTITAEQEALVRDVEAILDRVEPEEDTASSIVSSEEFSFLLAEDRDEPDGDEGDR